MRNKLTAKTICTTAMLAALIYVVSLFGIPFFGSKIQLSNALSILGGVLFGPGIGGIAAGLADAIHDVLSGDNPIELVLSVAVKASMAVAAGIFWRSKVAEKFKEIARDALAAAVGAVTYFLLHSAKHLILKTLVDGLTLPAAFTALAAKTPATAINAVAAVILISILAKPIRLALTKSKVL